MNSSAQRTRGLGIAVTEEPVTAGQVSLRRSAVAWLLGAVILCAAAAGVACLRSAKVDPLVLKQLRKPLTAWARGDIRPEPLERGIYFVLTLLSPVAALAGAWWAGLFRLPQINRFFAGLEELRRRSITGAAGLGMLLFVVAVTLALAFPSLAEVFRPLEGMRSWIWLVCGSLTLAAVTVRAPRAWRKRFAGPLRWSSLLAVFMLVAARVATAGIYDAYHIEKLSPVDWNTVFYSVSQAAAGARPMVDFTAQYGYYSSLLKPWFALVGLSAFSFTATMAALQGFSMLCLGWVLWRRMRSGPLLALCMAALGWLMMTWLGIYFAYYPIRLLFPAGSVLAVYAYLRRPTVAQAAVAGALLGGPGVWWNIDSGVVAMGSWVSVLAVKGLGEMLRCLPDARRTGRHLVISLGACVISFAVVYFALSADSRSWLDIRLLARFQAVFYIAGFSMLPMPVAPHLWQAVLGIYLAGLIFGLSGAIRSGRLSPDAGAILHLSVLGVGLFSYYQGRSHDFNLVHAFWPAVCLSFLFADRLLAAARAGILPPVYASGALPAAFLGVVCLACSAKFMPAKAAQYWRQLQDGRSRNPPMSPVADAARYIAGVCERAGEGAGSNSKIERSCAILSTYQASYFAALGMRSSLRGPSLYETLLKRDLDSLEVQLRSRKIPNLFVEDVFVEGMGSALVPLGAEFRTRLLGWYRVVGRNPAGNVLRLEPRTEVDKDSDATFLREFHAQARLSRETMDRWHAVAFPPSGAMLDTNGICASYPYDWRYCPFDNDFTLEIVFNPDAREPRRACLVSNRSKLGFEGFAIQRVDDTPNTFALETGDGRSFLSSASFPVAPGRDNYLAITRLGGHASIFINGKTVPVSDAHFKSATPLTFGNSEVAAHPFRGQILEAQWSSKGLGSDELERMWRRIVPASP